MLNKCHGFVLLSILVFISLSSLLGLHALNLALNNVKRTEHLWQHERTWYSAQQALTMIENQPIVSHAACLVPWISSAELAKKPMTWWQHRCSGNLAGIRYHYCLELLAKIPCVKGKNTDQSLFNAVFYRISLLALPPIKGAKIILQSVVVSAQQIEGICTGEPRVVHVGRHMWRSL